VPSSKQYDRAYFDRWYRDRRHAIAPGGELHRQVAFAVAVTERVLARPLRSVLDAGAGEGRWYPLLQRLRPDLRYIGFDSSEWAVRRWGRRRNLHLGSIESLGALDLDGPFDLVIAADIFHYLKAPALRQALAGLVPLVGGVAFLPTFTAEDAIEGDMVGFQQRRAATYRRYFQDAGLHSLGMHAWTTRTGWQSLSQLERPS
jgi:SAM-dependent methyltransferase